MTTTKPVRINIKITRKAYLALRKRAKQEGRTILAMLDFILGV